MGGDLERGDLVAVFGGSGFVGRYAVRALAGDGLRVRAAVRRPDLAGHLQTMGAVGQVQAIQANIRYPDSVARAVSGCRVVVNAVGSGLAPSGRQSFHAVHQEGAKIIGKAARMAGVERVIHISALGADPKGRANYARAKGLGEEALLHEFPDAIVLRPSVVFGPEDKFFNRFASLAHYSPLLPLIGGGRARFQPVFVGDVAAAVRSAVQGRAMPGSVYELGGPQILSFRQVLELIQDWTGLRRGYLPLPYWAAKLLALVTWPLPNSVRPLTVDQVRMLAIDNVVSRVAIDDGRTIEALGVTSPHAVGTVVPAYLEMYRTRGQFSHYRG